MSKVLVLCYSSYGQIEQTLSEMVGGAPYGATTIAGGDGSRQPTEIELAGARHQGKLVAKRRTSYSVENRQPRRAPSRTW